MGGGCCIGDCCVLDCGFCCVFDFSSSGDCCVGYTSSSNDSVDHAKKINEEFNQVKEDFERQGAAQEQAILDQINSSMDNFINELEKINHTKFSGRTLNINIDAIRQKRDELSKDVVGFIGDRLHDRIVTTDPELAPMLKEYDDDKRNKNVSKFCKKVLQEAKDDLKEQIRKTVKAQQDVVKKELENRLAEINNSLKQSTDAYNELVSAVQKDTKEQERLTLQYMYEYDIYKVLSDQLGIFDDIKVEAQHNRSSQRVTRQYD